MQLAEIADLIDSQPEIAQRARLHALPCGEVRAAFLALRLVIV